MIFEHTFTYKTKPTEAQARHAIDRASKQFDGRPFGLLRAFREGKKMTVVFADGFRPLEPDALAERLAEWL